MPPARRADGLSGFDVCVGHVGWLWIAGGLVRSPGGAGGTRTPYLRLAKAALSRLSYGPRGTGWHQSQGSRSGWFRLRSRGCGCVVGHPGLEPGTSVLSGLRSNHLS